MGVTLSIARDDNIRLVDGRRALLSAVLLREGLYEAMLLAEDYEEIDCRRSETEADIIRIFNHMKSVYHVPEPTGKYKKLADDLSKIGITLNIQTVDWTGGYAEDYRDGKLGFSVMYWSPDYQDPNAELEFLPGGIVGLRSGWTAEMDQELADMKGQIVSELDQDARVEKLKEMQEKTAEYGPFIPIVQYPKYMGVTSQLTGVEFSDSYRMDVRTIEWAE